MSSRLALESWQLLFPAIGIGIFAAIFCGVVLRVWRMQSPRVEHLGRLPLENEERPSAVAGRGEAGPGAPAFAEATAGRPTPATTNPVCSATHVR